MTEPQINFGVAPPSRTGAPSAGASRPVNDKTGGTFEDLATDPDDLSDLFPPSPDADPSPAPDTIAAAIQEAHESPTPEPIEEDSNSVIIHILKDGFTANGRTWYRGQTLEFDKNDQAYQDTFNRKGESWLHFDDSEQFKRYGDVMFRHGPWPGGEWENEQVAEREAKRQRQVPKLPTVMAPRR